MVASPIVEVPENIEILPEHGYSASHPYAVSNVWRDNRYREVPPAPAALESTERDHLWTGIRIGGVLSIGLWWVLYEAVRHMTWPIAAVIGGGVLLFATWCRVTAPKQ